MEIKSKGIVKNGFVSGIQTIISTLAYVIILFLLIHKFGKETGKAQFGLWTSIVSVPTALTVFGSGVSGCLLRYIPVYLAEKNYSNIKGIILNGLLFNSVLAAAICTLGYVFAEPLLSKVFKLNGHVPELYLTVYRATLLMFFINFAGSVFLSSLDGLQLIYKKNIILMTSSVIFCLLALFLIDREGIAGLVYAQIFQGLLVMVLSLIILWQSGAFSYTCRIVDRDLQKLFLTYGQGMQAISFSILFFEPISIFFLNRYSTLPIVGIYSIVNRVITQSRTLVVSAIQVIMPVISKQQQENSLNLPDLAGKAIRGGALLSMLGYSAILVLAFTVIVYTHEQKDLQYYLTFLVLLSASYFINIIASVPYSIFMGLGKLKPIIISHILSSGINILLFVAIGPKPLPFFLLLPPALAIALSSAYILYLFFKSHKNVAIEILTEDKLAYFLSAISVAISFSIYHFDGRLSTLLTFNVLYGIAMIYLIFKNKFLVDVRKRLFLKSE